MWLSFLLTLEILVMAALSTKSGQKISSKKNVSVDKLQGKILRKDNFQRKKLLFVKDEDL